MIYKVLTAAAVVDMMALAQTAQQERVNSDPDVDDDKQFWAFNRFRRPFPLATSHKGFRGKTIRSPQIAREAADRFLFAWNQGSPGAILRLMASGAFIEDYSLLSQFVHTDFGASTNEMDYTNFYGGKFRPIRGYKDVSAFATSMSCMTRKSVTTDDACCKMEFDAERDIYVGLGALSFASLYADFCSEELFASSDEKANRVVETAFTGSSDGFVAEYKYMEMDFALAAMVDRYGRFRRFTVYSSTTTFGSPSEAVDEAPPVPDADVVTLADAKVFLLKTVEVPGQDEPEKVSPAVWKAKQPVEILALYDDESFPLNPPSAGLCDEGWYFDNKKRDVVSEIRDQDHLDKINWYFINHAEPGKYGDGQNIQLGEYTTMLSRVTIHKYEDTSSLPYFKIYTKFGQLYSGSDWYSSAMTYDIEAVDRENVPIGSPVVLYIGEDLPLLFPDVPHIQLVLDLGSVVGDAGLTTHNVLKAAFSTDSGAGKDEVQLCVHDFILKLGAEAFRAQILEHSGTSF